MTGEGILDTFVGVPIETLLNELSRMRALKVAAWSTKQGGRSIFNALKNVAGRGILKWFEEQAGGIYGCSFGNGRIGLTKNGIYANIVAGLLIDMAIDAYNTDKEYTQKREAGILDANQTAYGYAGEMLGNLVVDSAEAAGAIALTDGFITSMAVTTAETATIGAGTAFATVATGAAGALVAAVELDWLTALITNTMSDGQDTYNSFADLAGDVGVAVGTKQSLEELDAQMNATRLLINAQREADGLEPYDFDDTEFEPVNFWESAGRGLSEMWSLTEGKAWFWNK